MSTAATDPDLRAAFPYGWVTVGTILGAWCADHFAYVAPIVTTKWLTRTEVSLAIAERRIPLIVAGCIVGALAGWYAERQLAPKVSLRRAVAYLVLLLIMFICGVDIAVMLVQIIRARYSQ